MFEDLTPPPLDKIIALIGAFAADPRPGKLDLGVGVYRDAAGRTPVMHAVKEAERRIWEAQESKGYVGFAGDAGYLDAMRTLILGDTVAAERVGGCATPGGTGAVRQILEAARARAPGLRVWVPAPSWPNHAAILDHLGIPWESYRYYDATSGAVDREGMRADLARAAAGDLILLHGCCHNPSGADLRLEDWRDLAALFSANGAIPFVDLAYQGFGDGVAADVQGLRHMAQSVPEMLIAASGSKTFGLYRERVGLALVIAETATGARAGAGLLAHTNRVSFSFPPDHGARIVTEILTTPALDAAWREELEAMRLRMTDNRRLMADALRAATGSDRFGAIADQKGMFSLLPLSPEEVETLRADHGVYMVPDGRMNVAGITPAAVDGLARAIAEVTR